MFERLARGRLKNGAVEHGNYAQIVSWFQSGREFPRALFATPV